MKLTTEIIRELLDYDQHTGIFTWRVRSREWFGYDRDWKRWNTQLAGHTAGTVSKNAHGYPRLRIRVLGKIHHASRLAFIWMGEPLPEQVDHDDGDSLNNRWANLLASSAAENQKNMSMSRANTSGVTGVYWNKSKGKWLSQCRLNGKQIYLGLFDDIDEAASAVSKYRAENGFSDRHGQNLSAYQIAPDPVQTSMSESAKLEIQ